MQSLTIDDIQVTYVEVRHSYSAWVWFEIWLLVFNNIEPQGKLSFLVFEVVMRLCTSTPHIIFFLFSGVGSHAQSVYMGGKQLPWTAGPGLSHWFLGSFVEARSWQISPAGLKLTYGSCSVWTCPMILRAQNSWATGIMELQHQAQLNRDGCCENFHDLQWVSMAPASSILAQRVVGWWMEGKPSIWVVHLMIMSASCLITY